ncbi:hypothetical protein [Chitinophaga sancti]|uniref:Immunity protein Imm1 n=1 Tax=Chitinophaga sancti TaxID=1004 RepID=A0A1K1LQM5_9BACT|nr:hypothetical protein [Chitinophaga sancti]WQD64924.1 hypothetical protein U0033_11015 [Chitinophaga sancti]WQG89452.1 hypothetical protein SR876_31455 [Chitinophaga sancti]SFW13167.1 hypothetical protein SAMN05661012_00137 [Chitinophaga sancti]
MSIRTRLFSQINNEILSLEQVLHTIRAIRPEDVRYFNDGCFATLHHKLFITCKEQDPENISFRYDDNSGEAWFGVTKPNTSILTDAGDEYHVPLFSFVSREKAMQIITEFFNNPAQKPPSILWEPAEQFEWPYSL